VGVGTSFVGRSDVTRQLDTLIEEERLVTLTGTGGIGKTRVAAKVAALRAESGDTTAFVEMAPAKPGDDLELTLARQLGQASIDTFVVGLDGAMVLIVLDNCEHVVVAAASLAARLIEHPNVRVLATSRSPLSVPGEYVVRLGPLRASADVGDESSPAFELFLDRATTAGASWLDIPEQRSAAAEIVRRLDGVPLAIELAAARSRAIGPTDLLALLPRQLDLLDGVGQQSPTSPRGVRSVVRASYEPLHPDCQKAFRALSLIPQGVDLEFAHALTGADDQLVTLDLLSQLIDQSLVYSSQGASGDLVYRLLEPVRAFGLEQLDVMGEADEVGNRYVDAVCKFAHRIVVATATSFSGPLLDQIAQRYEHLLHAIEVALEIDELPDRAYRLLLPLYAPTKAPRREQAQLAAKVRQRWQDTADPFRAAAYAIMGHVALWAGGEDPAPYAREALDDPGATRIARIIAYRVLAFDACQYGDRDGARAYIESALATAASRGGSFERELKMSWASLVDDPDDVPEAIDTAEAMSLLASESGETVTVVWAASVCAHQYLRLGEIRDARLAAERALVFAERAASPWPTSSAQRVLGFVCTAEGRWDAALGHFRSALESVVAAGDIEGVTVTVRSAAICAQHCGEHQLAGELWNSVPTLFRPSSLPPLFTDAEADLIRRIGEPLPLPLRDSISAARDGLTSVVDAVGGVTEERGRHEVFRFKGYELDAGRRELRHESVIVHIEPQVFDVLLRLIVDAGTFVAKEQLMDDVWGSRFVSASALTSRIKSARAATGDDGKAQQVIRTVHGRGFMFVAELDERPTQRAERSNSDQPAGS
jgi:predicted ATPase/DNA-binding winged helix-turn-helix (wHTH) protein